MQILETREYGTDDRGAPLSRAEAQLAPHELTFDEATDLLVEGRAKFYAAGRDVIVAQDGRPPTPESRQAGVARGAAAASDPIYAAFAAQCGISDPATLRFAR